MLCCCSKVQSRTELEMNNKDCFPYLIFGGAFQKLYLHKQQFYLSQ